MSDDHLLPIDDPERWQARALCRPDNRPASMTPREWTAIWFPQGETGHPGDGRADPAELALNHCNRCPVKASCHEAGRTEPAGIWGGLDRNTTFRVDGVKPCRWCGELFHPHWSSVVYCTLDCQTQGRVERSRRSSAAYRANRKAAS